MSKLILISSTQYPGYGGAATNAYALIKYLRDQKFDVMGIFFEDNNSINVDPDNIGHVFRMSKIPFEKRDQKEILKYRQMIQKEIKQEPAVMLCKNYMAPIFCKALFPESKNIYLLSGITHFSFFFPKLSAQDFLKSTEPIPVLWPEVNCIESSDLVVTNSALSLKIFRKIYPQFLHKIYPLHVDTTKEIHSIITNKNAKTEKVYDIIVAASILTRTMKNNLFLIDVLNDPLLEKYNKIIIGSNNTAFKNIKNAIVYDLMPHEKLMGYMAQSKLLLYPSLCDANPNTVREAIFYNCLTLVSNNIGYYESFPAFSVCTSYDKSEWIGKIIYMVDNYDTLINSYNVEFKTGESILDVVKLFV